MNKTIHIREAVTPEEVERFWQELHAYHARDIFPDPAEEDRAYFLDDSQYRAAVQRIHDREGDRCYYLLFRREGRDIGFALTALYPSEDGKCFVMEFCVLPEFRGGGTGTACARLLLDWAADRGAQYGELNAADPRRIRFWSRLGFRPNGRDEWGDTLMLRPPEQALPITVELLRDPADWQLRKLENGYLAEIGEPLLLQIGQRAAPYLLLIQGKELFCLVVAAIHVSVAIVAVIVAVSIPEVVPLGEGKEAGPEAAGNDYQGQKDGHSFGRRTGAQVFHGITSPWS